MENTRSKCPCSRAAAREDVFFQKSQSGANLHTALVVPSNVQLRKLLLLASFSHAINKWASGLLLLMDIQSHL